MRVLVLIISNNEDQPPYIPVYSKLKSIWREYMNTHPSIECLFLENDDEKDKVIENNTFYVRGKSGYHPSIRDKTIECFEYFMNQESNYDFIIRTNLSSLWNFDALMNYLDTLPRTNVYSGIFGYHYGSHFIAGAGFIMPPDVVKKLIQHKEMLNESNILDDVDIGYTLYKIGIPFTPGKRKDILSIKDFLDYKYDNSYYHYRIKMDRDDRDNESLIMKRLLEKIYNQ
jgi:hypothetical protein